MNRYLIKLPPSTGEIIAQSVCLKIKLLPEHLRVKGYDQMKKQLEEHYPEYVKEFEKHKFHILGVN